MSENIEIKALSTIMDPESLPMQYALVKISQPSPSIPVVAGPPIHIQDYMTWSILNIFLGGFLLGFIAVGLSTQTKKHKQRGNIKEAKRFSFLALLSNLLITIIFCSLITFLIVYLVYFMSYLDQ